MALRALVSSTHGTIQDIEAAAEERYWDGCELAVQGRSYAAIYLLGYARRDASESRSLPLRWSAGNRPRGA